ncbi:hypothetical protein SHIRM173S_08453 [Streptomyces hirsutus]
MDRGLRRHAPRSASAWTPPATAPRTARPSNWGCAGGPNQKWTVTGARDIVNPQADKCLDVTGNNAANATRLQIWTCTGAANQKWTVG